MCMYFAGLNQEEVDMCAGDPNADKENHVLKAE